MNKGDPAIHPCVQIIQTNGVAVDHIHRYPLPPVLLEEALSFVGIPSY
jgi:hypothetical protein